MTFTDKELKELLGEVEDNKFREVVDVLEMQRARMRRPHLIDGMLEKIRSRLTHVQPPRRVSRTRLLCLPFEDMLITASDYSGSIVGKIPRASVRPCWWVLERYGNPALLEEVAGQLQNYTSEDSTTLREIGQPLWAHAAAVLSFILARCEEDAPFRREVQVLLGQEAFFPVLKDVAMATGMANDLFHLLDGLPAAPMRRLDPEALDLLQETLAQVALPDRQNFVRRWITARLSNPAEILKIMAGLAERTGTRLAGDEVGVDNAVIIQELENRIERLTTATPAPNTVIALAADIGRCVRGVKDVAAAADGQEDQKTAEKLQTALRVLGAKAGTEILAAESSDLLRYSVLNRTPSGHLDLSTLPDFEGLETVEDQVMALRILNPHAPSLGLGKEVDQKLDEISDSMREQAEEILAEISRRGVEDVPDETENNFYFTLRMMEISGQGTTADELRLKFREMCEE